MALFKPIKKYEVTIGSEGAFQKYYLSKCIFPIKKNLYKSLLRNVFLYFPLNLWFHIPPSFTPPLVGQYAAIRNSPYGHIHDNALSWEFKPHEIIKCWSVLQDETCLRIGEMND